VCLAAKNVQMVERLSNDLGYRVRAIEMDSSSVDDLFKYDRSKSASLSSLPVACTDKRRNVVNVALSSGSTGRPKAVTSTHWTVLAELAYLKRLFTTDQGNALGNCNTFNYASGRFILFGAFHVGYNCVIMNGFNLDNYLDALQKYKFSSIIIGAAAFYRLMTYEKLNQYDLSSVSAVVPFGAKITYIDELKAFLEQHPHISKFKVMYGASEAGMISELLEQTFEGFLSNLDDCGPLVAGQQVKLVGPETGRQLSGPNERGLLLVKGATVFPGYYDASKPDKLVRDDSTFDPDGFYKSGDIVYFDEHEHLHYVSRFKETIVCRTVSKHQPHQFEEVVLRHPAVREAYVIGVDSKREKCTQCPRVFVTLRPDYEFTSQTNGHAEPPDESIDGEPLVFKGTNRLCTRIPDETRRRLAREILHFANSRLDWIKQLMGGIVLLDEIPTLKGSGKVDKSYLRSLTLDQVEIYGDLSE
jgi:acyl-coenzyme A synthetase/AMP-(fatty) acid ligase